MSQENLELVRQEYVAFASRDWDALAEIWHPDIEYEAGGRGMKGSGADTRLEQSVARLITFKDGRIWRVKEYPTLEEALEAAGVSE